MTILTISPKLLREAVRHISFVLILILWMLMYWAQQPHDTFGNDMYPLWLAAHALLRGVDPYGTSMMAHFDAIWQTYHWAFASVGFVYPLPAVVGLWPFLLLPLLVTIILFLVCGSFGSFLAITLRDNWQSLTLLPFCFLPFQRAIVVKQPSLIWFALTVILLLAMRKHWPIIVGYCIVMLPAKPQTGFLFALVGLIWAWRNERRTLLWIGVWGALIWGGSFVLQPTWVFEWIASVRHYSAIAPTPSLLPWGLLLIVACYRLPWYAQVGVAQVVLFPLSDSYSALPFLLAWVGIGGPLALWGSGMSWLWVILRFHNPMVSVWLLLVLPLALCALWRAYQRKFL